MENIEAIGPKYKNIAIILVKLIIAAGLIWFLMGYIQPDKIYKALINSQKGPLISAFLLAFLILGIRFLKWYLILKEALGYDDRKGAVNSLLIGMSAGIFTPFQIGEIVGRSLAIKEKKMKSVTKAYLLERFFATVILLYWGAVSSVIFLKVYLDITPLLLILMLIILLLLIIPGWKFIIDSSFRSRFIPGWFSKFPAIERRVEKLKNLSVGRALIKKLLIISALIFFLYNLQFALLVTAFNVNTELPLIFLVANVVFFTKGFIPPVSMGELGIRESAAVFFYSLVGVNEAAAFSAAIFLFIFNLVFPSVAGMFLMVKK